VLLLLHAGSLLLCCCRLDTAAASALHGALLATPGLQLLSLQKAVFDYSSPTDATTNSSNSNNSSGSKGASLFSPALAAHPALAKLELQQVSGLQQHDWRQLGTYIAQAPHLQELLLQEVQLGHDAATSLAAGLLLQDRQTLPAATPGLRVLDLGSCALGQLSRSIRQPLQPACSADDGAE
jgi:hypothetical protein